MTTIDKIEQLGADIGREFHAVRVVLFGSYAYGTPTADSDVDLLVVLPEAANPARKFADICLKLDPSFPVDILVRTPENVSERLIMGDDFMKDILEKGKVLYEAHDR
ncbi:MAG: nucleotidyltransferase domain-containing protein [FCB group bacterium]|nr:nucleotidyltransferase domain-containing protein [FCB group bacterium]